MEKEQLDQYMQQYIQNMQIKNAEIAAKKEMERQMADLDEKPTYKEIYSVKDEKFGFDEIFVGVNDGVTIRQFSQACAEGKAVNIKMYPEDFSLWKLGKIDVKTGQYIADTRLLVKAIDFVKKEDHKE